MAEREQAGHAHPLTQIINEVVDAFRDLGFVVAEGPEIEDEYHNFDALNVPADHPARDMWDTFWLKPENTKKLLRTHTSPVQVRYLENNKPPLRIIVPGKVFRYEATDARHEAQFYQIEGLMVGHKVSVADMKGSLEHFLQKIFGKDVQIRLRPSFFPFVEPGFEVDMLCPKCFASPNINGETSPKCSVCGNSGWLEIMGAGLVYPHVFRSVGLDTEEWQGFAFGMGPERLAMVKWGIDDIRNFYSGDLRFINQF
ncbi:MAG: phenylalanine--tRNA ligase subunit alpha [Candidatus Paceibacterota bacterium]|jgi:phenylalanyl-tRNA synthetase alpha chain